MSNKKDPTIKTDSLHILLAIRRSKENEGQTQKGEICHREIVRGSIETAIRCLKARLEPGTWRIYLTVNRRDVKKAFRLFQIELINNQESWLHRIDGLWKKCLLQKGARYDKFFLLDVDGPLRFAELFLIENQLKDHGFWKTPNGWHVITDPFNVNAVKIPEEITVLADGYRFVEKVTI